MPVHPQNPTGTALKKEELEKICDLIIAENNTRADGEKKLYLMFDQMYWTLTYGDTIHYNPVSLRPAMRAYTVFIDGISKSLAATGVRVGWSFGPANIIAKMKALLSHIGAWAPMAEQYAVAAYLNQPEKSPPFKMSLKKPWKTDLEKFTQALLHLKKKGFPLMPLHHKPPFTLLLNLIFLVKQPTAKRWVRSLA